MRKSRASSSDHARAYRQEGHDDATVFALLLGMEEVYTNNQHAKKDVVDPSGDSHSVKSGQNKWQIFLYGRNRFIDDPGFQSLNGIGSLLVHCIDVFPPTYAMYEEDKSEYKRRLKTPMREIKDRLQRRGLLRAFLSKAIFNSGEVNYLTVLDKGIYHVFSQEDVLRVFSRYFRVSNSKKRAAGQFDDQKVLFQCRVNSSQGNSKWLNVGELEMRNDSNTHYREIRFNMYKRRAVEMLLKELSSKKSEYNDSIYVYGGAVKKFGNWSD